GGEAELHEGPARHADEDHADDHEQHEAAGQRGGGGKAGHGASERGGIEAAGIAGHAQPSRSTISAKARRMSETVSGCSTGSMCAAFGTTSRRARGTARAKSVTAAGAVTLSSSPTTQMVGTVSSGTRAVASKSRTASHSAM